MSFDAQDIVAYGLAVLIFLGFGYLAWASRQKKNQVPDPKDKKG